MPKDRYKQEKLLIMKKGEFFGYPVCCSHSFMNFCYHKDKYPRNPIQSKNTDEGLVPCVKHAKLITKNKIAIKDLIHDRVCSVPFSINDFIPNTVTYLKKDLPIPPPMSEEFTKWMNEHNLSTMDLYIKYDKIRLYYTLISEEFAKWLIKKNLSRISIKYYENHWKYILTHP